MGRRAPSACVYIWIVCSFYVKHKWANQKNVLKITFTRELLHDVYLFIKSKHEMEEQEKYAAIGIYYTHAGRVKCHHNSCRYRVTISGWNTFFPAVAKIHCFSRMAICRKPEEFNELYHLPNTFAKIFQSLTFWFSLWSNGSGSREATTIKHSRGRVETSGSGQDHVPVPPTMNDKYVDLMALVLGHRSESSPVNYEKVIIKSEGDDSNPNLADLMDVKLRWVPLDNVSLRLQCIFQNKIRAFSW